jgi:hypothetical protein
MKIKLDALVHLYFQENSDEDKKKKGYLHAVVSREDLDNPTYGLPEKA